MRNFAKSLVAFLMVVIILASLCFSTAAQTSRAAKLYNWGTRHVVCDELTSYANNYYTGAYNYDTLSNQSSSSLKQSLKTLMTSTHTYTSSYNDCHYKADQTDCENENGKVVLIYTNYSATMNQWNGWNREHVWPQSLGGGNTSGGGADLHHIRPSDAGVNSSRGNKKYGNVTNGTEKYGTNPATGCLGGEYNSTYFEPLDNVKGDIARICLYVYVRWGSAWGADSITEVFQSVDVLLEWCKLDPVDEWEMGRNDVIESIQGNRNVFIDYPEYAWLIFGEEIPANMVTPSGNAKGNSNPDEDPVDPNPGENPGENPDEDPVDPNPGENPGQNPGQDPGENPEENPDDGECTHIFDEWADLGDIKVRTCTLCGIEEVLTNKNNTPKTDYTPVIVIAASAAALVVVAVALILIIKKRRI